MSRVVNIGLIQMTCEQDKIANYEKTVERIIEAAGQGAKIVCTQELFKSRYFPQVEDSANYGLAERLDVDGPAVAELCELAGSLGIVLIASLFEKRATGLYHNAAIVMDADGRLLGKYRKMHIPDDPQYYEKFYFAPGDLGYPVFRTRYADIGVLICWDQWFPEAARLCALKGAEIICIPTAIGYSSPTEFDPAYRESWQIVQQGHAVANACFVAAINRVGFEENPKGGHGIHFWGGSFIADPNGQVLRRASDTDEELVVFPVDLSVCQAVKDNYSFPFRDRRIDSYQELTKLYLDADE